MFRIHRAWPIAAVAFVALVGAAGFRAAPGVLMVPLQDEFGWSRATTSLAVSVNLVLYGLTAPFAAALMDRFGIRTVTAAALVLIAAGSGLTVGMSASWQLVLCWGVLIGLGTGSMAMVFAATVTGRWFVKHRGLVIGVLTAGGSTGQLVFLPVLAALAHDHGWRTATLVVTGAALAVVPLVLLVMRERPADVGLLPYGATEPADEPQNGENAARVALRTLNKAVRTKPFWLLAGGFLICGASTNGLVGTHFIPAAHDHGMPETTAANLLALVGIFDIAGTVASGWLTDRVDARILLGWYYALRGLSLLVLPMLFADEPHPSMLVFVVFYGLDWVATVPPTIALARKAFGPRDGTIVFGWVFAAHQLGAAAAAAAAGALRTSLGTYTLAWWGAGVLCLIAAVLSVAIGRARPRPAVVPAVEAPVT
ncbi:putative MFS-type transporter YhjX [Actinomadura rubteroloni]|uniref:Putative MFS-type transporter YhjX n=1 Tax=Actinomadura rubteroloni TaxID=1926885 RepID=A0A2P4UKA3_9ACTN|nr:MFS transporter [Actinomadura rubteroloni]POM25487.1 putative MFS-type transporter YhjX [Actinomadura rubteroloni]